MNATTDQALLARLRLRAQAIAPGVSASPADVVAHLGAVQAQDYRAALWAVALRTPGATRSDVERAIADGTIVRTWPMRGTLHFVAATDARWMLELLTPRIQRGAERRHRQLGLAAEDFARGRTIVAQALGRDRILCRTALFAALQQGGIKTAGQRGIHLLQHLTMDRMLCFGPHAGREPTFTLFDAWLPGAAALDRDESLRTVAERYFTSHGPATLHDFVWWTGLTVGDARRALEMAAPALEGMRSGDTDYWMACGLRDVGPDAEGAHLLPAFDEILLGYRDRSATLAPKHAGLVVPGANGVFQAIMLLDARVCGTWRRATGATSTALALAPFVRLGARRRGMFGAAAERYAQFLGTPVTISA